MKNIELEKLKQWDIKSHNLNLVDIVNKELKERASKETLSPMD